MIDMTRPDAAQLPPLPDEFAQRVETQVDAFLQKLLTADMAGGELDRHLDAAFRLGRKEIAEATRLNTRFLDQHYAGIEASPAYQAMARLRDIMDTLDPGRQGDLLSPNRILGIIPGGIKLRAYLRRFASAQSQIKQLVAQLSAAQDDLERDIVAIDDARAQLWTALRNLQAAAHFARQMHDKLTAQVERLKSSDARRATALEQEALFHAARALEGILAQQAVTANGYLALDPLKRTAREMSTGIDRLNTTGMSALALAQMIAIATGHQQRVQQALSGTRDTIGRLIEQTSVQLGGHVQTVAKTALDPVIDIAKLQTAFDHTFKAMDAMDNFRVAALAAMRRNNEALQTLIDKSAPWLERTAAAPLALRDEVTTPGPVAL